MSKRKKVSKKRVHNALQKIQKTLATSDGILKELNRLLDSLICLDGFIMSLKKELIKNTEINKNVEDTLLNVLLAIRQNEYLHAWYPPQQGIPEMKVTGSHPLSSAKRI